MRMSWIIGYFVLKYVYKLEYTYKNTYINQRNIMSQKTPKEEILSYFNLSDNEAALYLLMLQHPRVTAQELVLKSNFKRTLLYHILKNLEEKWLITSQKDQWKTLYIVAAPDKLYEILEQKEQEFESRKKDLKKLIPKLKNNFSLRNKIPNIRVVEWMVAFENILTECLLTDEKEIFMYEDIYTGKPALEVREAFEKKRISKKIQKNILFFEDEDALDEIELRKYNDYTLYHALDEKSIENFQIDMMIFDSKIFYINYFSNYDVQVVVIEDISLYEMQKNIFESLWKNSVDKTLHYIS